MAPAAGVFPRIGLNGSRADGSVCIQAASHHALAALPKYGPPCLFLPTTTSSHRLSSPMDDCHHESAHFHPLTRKRKADTDDRAVAVAPDTAATDSLLLGPDATPRIPTEPADQASASWLLAHHHSAMISSWQESPGASSSSTLFAAHTTAHQDGPSKPKRPRIEIPHSIPMLPRKLRKGRGLYSSNVSSRSSRPAVYRRDSGIVSAVEPRKPTPLRTGSLTPHDSPTRASLSLPVTPIEPSYAHVPPHQPPINRETLKELDLDAILRNPQLRQCSSSLSNRLCLIDSSLIALQDTISCSIPVCSFVRHSVAESGTWRRAIG